MIYIKEYNSHKNYKEVSQLELLEFREMRKRIPFTDREIEILQSLRIETQKNPYQMYNWYIDTYGYKKCKRNTDVILFRDNPHGVSFENFYIGKYEDSWYSIEHYKGSMKYKISHFICDQFDSLVEFIKDISNKKPT